MYTYTAGLEQGVGDAATGGFKVGDSHVWSRQVGTAGIIRDNSS